MGLLPPLPSLIRIVTIDTHCRSPPDCIHFFFLSKRFKKHQRSSALTNCLALILLVQSATPGQKSDAPNSGCFRPSARIANFRGTIEHGILRRGTRSEQHHCMMHVRLLHTTFSFALYLKKCSSQLGGGPYWNLSLLVSIEAYRKSRHPQE